MEAAGARICENSGRSGTGGAGQSVEHWHFRVSLGWDDCIFSNNVFIVKLMGLLDFTSGSLFQYANWTSEVKDEYDARELKAAASKQEPAQLIQRGQKKNT